MANNDGGTVEAISTAIEREGLPWQAGETPLVGLSIDEKRAHLGLVVPEEELLQMAIENLAKAAEERRELEAAGLFGAPTSWDWRNVSGQNYVTVKNQGNCGSCVSFCTCAVMEANTRIKLQSPALSIDLSEGFMQFCGGASCAGWGLTSGLDFAKSTGTTDEACMPYQPQNMNCSSSRCSDWQNRLTKIKDYTGHSSMEARKNAIATTGPVLAGMRVYSDFYAYTTGVYLKTGTATEIGLHCITVVGYDDTQQCWILKNSWGTGWGDDGFCRIRYGQADLLIDTNFAFYSVVPNIPRAWRSGMTIAQTYATRDAQNAWAYFVNFGWRRIQPGSGDGVENMLTLFAQAVAKNRKVTIDADGDHVYGAYLM